MGIKFKIACDFLIKSVIYSKIAIAESVKIKFVDNKFK